MCLACHFMSELHRGCGSQRAAGRRLMGGGRLVQHQSWRGHCRPAERAAAQRASSLGPCVPSSCHPMMDPFGMLGPPCPPAAHPPFHLLFKVQPLRHPARNSNGQRSATFYSLPWCGDIWL